MSPGQKWPAAAAACGLPCAKAAAAAAHAAYNCWVCADEKAELGVPVAAAASAGWAAAANAGVIG